MCKIIRFFGIALIFLSIFPLNKSETNVIDNKISYEAQLENFLALTADFFTGLYDFKQFKNTDLEINATTFEKIDNIVDHYVYIIKKAHGLLSPEEIVQHEKLKSVQRRNAPVYNQSYYKIRDELELKGFEEINIVPTDIPIDIILFDKTFVDIRLHIWQYAASLEVYNYQNQSGYPVADTLVLYKYVDASFTKVFSTPVPKATKLLSKNIDDKIYIVVASCDDEHVLELNKWRGSILFEVDVWQNVLIPVQMLGTSLAYDVTFWEDFDHLYMGLAIGNQNLSNIGETKSVVYRWLGGHFDIVDNLAASDARKVVEFTIGSERFIIIANYRNKHGVTDAYSPIYRYDIHEDRFILYQHLSTHAAVDVKYFNIVDQESTYEEAAEQHFLLIANQYEIDINGKKDFKTASILYKFSENYFVPFQGFELYSATEWLPFKDPNGKPFLLVNCYYEGLRAFNYDGWKFVEAPLEFGGDALGRGIKSIRMQNFLGQPVLVVANPENGLSTQPNMFRPIFKVTTSIDTEKANMLAWCQSRLAEASQFDSAVVVDQMALAPKLTDPVVYIPGTIDFANDVHIGKLSTDAIWTDNYLIDDTVLRNINNLHGDLSHHMGYVDALLNKSETLIHTNKPFKLRGSLSAPRIIATSTKLDQVETKFFNNQDFDEIRSKILQNQLSDVLQFDKLTIDTTLEFRQINGRPIDSLLFKSHDHKFETLIIDNALVQKSLSTHLINNATFDSTVIILNNTDQYFNFLEVNHLKTHLINSPTLNKVDVRRKRETSYYVTNDDLNIKDLKTDTLNGINIAMLYENSLKKYGNQEVIGDYEIPELYANNFVGPELSNVRPENLINTVEGVYVLDQDIAFKRPLQVQNDLKILNRLNNILAENGELQILLKDSDKPQKIVGNKVFESVELLDPIDLQGMIDSSALDKMNPVSSIGENLILEGDFVLDNSVTIRKYLGADAIVATSNTSDLIGNSPTVSNLLQHGLKLEASEISIPFEFTQPFKVSNLNVPYINQVPVDSWVYSSEIPTVISGRKIFTSDLQISGSCKLLNTVNGINVPEMLTNTLLSNSDRVQKVAGRVVFEKITSDRITSSSTTLGYKPLSLYLTSSTDQYFNQGIILVGEKESSAGYLEVQNIITLDQTQNGKLGYNEKDLVQQMNNLYSDCITRGDKRHVFASKTFKNLTVGELHVKNDGLNLPEYKRREIRQAATTYTKTYEGQIHIDQPIFVQKLTYTGSLDGVSHIDFGSQWLLVEGEQVITAPITISKVITEGPIAMDGPLNGIYIPDLQKSVVYTNKDYVLPYVDFENGFRTLAGFTVKTNISNLNFPDDILLKYAANLQHVSGIKKFSNLKIMGLPTLSTGYLGSIDIENFCAFVDSNLEIGNNLKILGSANFISDVDVLDLNGYDLDKLLNGIWFSNKDTTITGEKQFGDAKFGSEIIANNLVNNVDLNWIENNYFSLSKNQTITGYIEFQGKNTFLSNLLATSSVEVIGSINGIQSLPEFLYDSLNKYTEQVLEGKFIFDKLIIQGDLHGIINNIDFEHDVMRYDSTTNYIIGHKIFNTVNINSLLLKNDVLLGGVNINDWFQNSVACYSDTDLYVLEAPVTLVNGGIFQDGIVTSGLVNGLTFNKDTILLKYSNQTITGAKEFLPIYDQNSMASIYNHVLQINNLRIALLEAFLYDLVILNNDENGYSSFVFQGKGLKFTEQLNVREITGKPIKSASLVYGVDLPVLQRDITNVSSFINYENMDSDFAYLNYVADLLKHNIESQARFLHHYEVVQQIEGDVNNYTYGHNYPESISVYNDGNMQSMYWNKDTNKFEYQTGLISSQPSTEMDTNSNELNYVKNIVPVLIENKKCLVILDSQTELKCKMDYALDYVLLDTYITPGVMTVNIVKSKIGTLLVFLLQQKSKQGLPIGSVVIYLVNNLNEKNPSKILQTLRPTRPSSISLVLNNKDDNSQTVYRKMLAEPQITDPNIEFTKNYETNDYISEEVRSEDVFLAIASDKVQRAMHHGFVEIYRLNPSKQLFELAQSVPSMAPQQVKFAVLPISNELMLYVLSRQQARPLSIMRYEGVAGFREVFAASTVPHGNKLVTLTTEDEHFVFIGDQNYTTVLRAKFEDLHR